MFRYCCQWLQCRNELGSMFSAKHIRARKKENKSQNHIIVLFVGFLCLLLVQFVQFIFEFEIQTEENTNKGERSDGDSSISQLQMCVSHVFEIPSLYAISFCILYVWLYLQRWRIDVVNTKISEQNKGNETF